ncbi:hypothetical protein GXW74_12945 [Roseomonas eburnea]|uniref:Uncharacterized protein n=1 Tax=Neoroseomonas eburnea TaxID=1346889 RepID=A0A9X9XCG0_9PROT|nr:hypothetical protein [Neoroseomonas eburnea]MBR0681396.1 hypothetical protein [Neoroseomonas eburnea]
MRRRVLLGLLLPAGCGPQQPPDFSYGGAGFQPANARLNLAYAERNLGDMSRYRGKPAEAAAALAQFEAAIDGMRRPDSEIRFQMTRYEMLLSAIREVRGAVGIPMEVQPSVAAQALADAVGPLTRGDAAAIRRALSNPIFTLGPDATFARLTNLPPLPALESVAPALTFAAGNP